MRVCFVEAIGITLRMYYCEFSSLPPESTLRAMEIALAVTQAAVKHGYSPLKDEQRTCIESVQLCHRLMATVANHHLARQRAPTWQLVKQYRLQWSKYQSIIVVCRQNPSKDTLIR